MELSLVKGTTGKIVHVLIKDSSVTTGAGLTGLAFGTASLIAYYMRPGDTSATAIPLVTAALGTWTSGGFKEVDAVHFQGLYEFGIPNACLASGANQVEIRFQGAANMQQTSLLFELTGWNNQDATAGGISRIDAAVSSRMATYTQPAGFLAATFPTTVASTTNITSATGINLTQINGVSIAGTGTQVGSAFLNFFNVATPTGTVNSLPASIPGASDGLFIAGVNDHVTIINGIAVGGTVNLGGGLNLFTGSGNALNITGTAALGDVVLSSLSNSGTTILTGDTTIGNITFGGTWNITGAAAFAAGIDVEQSALNSAAITISGNGSGAGIEVDGGTTGNGITIAGQGGGKDISLEGDALLHGGITGSVASLGSGAITNAVFATDTGLKNIRSGTAQAGGNLTITLDAGASAVTNFYQNDIVRIVSGTGVGQARFITSYNGSSKAAVVAQWFINPDNTSGFVIQGYDNLATSLTAAAIDAQLSATHGPGAWGSTATGGAFNITITVTDGTSPLQNVLYAIYNNVGVVVGLGTTNASGQGTFSANAGTYTPALVLNGYVFSPSTRTVTGNQTGTLVNNLVMTAVTPIPSPTNPSMCNVGGTMLDGSGNPVQNVAGTMSLRPGAGKHRPLVDGGNTLVNTEIKFTTNSSGVVKAVDGTSQLSVVRTDGVFQSDGSAANAYWLINCPELGIKDRSQILAVSTFDLRSIVLPT